MKRTPVPGQRMLTSFLTPFPREMRWRVKGSLARGLAILALLAAPGSGPVQGADPVSLDRLLRQLTDLSQLAEFPDPAYVTRQFSSYDRASQTAADHERWFANSDRGFMLYDGVVADKTPYFISAPQPGQAADGSFAAGTHLGIAPNRKPAGSYVWVYATAADGGAVEGKIPQGYILKSALTLDPQGHVLAEMDGPGCVVRIWSPDPNDTGNIRIYLDGNKEPALDAPLLDLLGGKWQVENAGQKWVPFPEPIASEHSRGWNLYFPIAYAKHCKIVVDRPDIYYHVDYRTYARGTEVATFHLDDLAQRRQALAQIVKVMQGTEPPPIKERVSINTYAPGLLKPGAHSEFAVVAQGRTPIENQVLASGSHNEVTAGAGPQAIALFDVTVTKFDDEAKVLRGLVLTGTFDGADRPQICCPLGDFFASSPGLNPYRSLPIRVSRSKHPDALHLTMSWWMPYEKSAVFQISNQGTGSAHVSTNVGTVPYPWTKRSLYFHARWRTQTMKTRPFRDWTYCDLQGQGIFVGDMLSVLNPVSAWWGEGDEKIYVDGEKFPSWFGTGTEDYYGFGWCDPRPFHHAYHNQTRCDGPGNRGHTSLNRFHILDNIPFKRSFRFDLELWHWTPDVEVNFAATCYWYAHAGATDDFQPAPARVLQELPELPPPFKVPGALEGEQLKILGRSSAFEIGPQDAWDVGGQRWSGGRHLWVRPSKDGEWVDLALPVPADGQYRLVVYLTKAPDYGIVQFHLNGVPLGHPIDTFEPDRVAATGALELGIVDLKKGQATLRVEVIGTNKKSVGLRYMWGLDCVVLKPASQ